MTARPMPETAGHEVSEAQSFTSLQSEASVKERPQEMDVTSDILIPEKESNMQTAKQVKPASDSGITNDMDNHTKEVSGEEKVTKFPAGDMASLFGPLIQDDVKGVRSQIQELIQSELQGELGQRFSRNLRIVIRREIAAAVDDQFDRV